MLIPQELQLSRKSSMCPDNEKHTANCKSKLFFTVSQGFLNGRLLQSTIIDCTVCFNGLYSLRQRTIQSIAEDCSNSTDGRV